jgi:phospholipid/cholesterol/gamma-HCH transport system ATP-binding protein
MNDEGSQAEIGSELRALVDAPEGTVAAASADKGARGQVVQVPERHRVPDDRGGQEMGAEGSLTDGISADVAPAVEEFLEEAAQQNEAASEAVAEGDKNGEIAHYISFEGISKSFGDFHVLKDVSFFVNSGETLCILGRSGVGKSVSLQMLLGFLKPDSGTINVAGEDITRFDEKRLQAIRRKVTMVFQNGALFDSISVGENVAFPLRERGELGEHQIFQVVKGLLEMVGVAGMDNLLPSDLSTGMKRSVAIARALASQPEAVLYDEPTTMVDPLMGQLLGNLIDRLKQQLHLTSIVVTHDMRFAKKLADRVVFLHEGNARFFGTIEEMEQSEDPILQEFLSLDKLVLPVIDDAPVAAAM